ncbi:MAG TPA: DUF4476 domain-containing protein [Firmicutes bacterium]|nr:DUF4476 domain-containing protein [Bacillota bacterium]
MKKIVLVLIAAVLLIGVVAGKEKKESLKDDEKRPQIIDCIWGIKKEFTEIERRFLKDLTYYEKKEFESRMGRIDSFLNQIEKATLKNKEGGVSDQDTGTKIREQGMEEDVFKKNVEYLTNNCKFDKDRIPFMDMMVSGRRITAEQAAFLLREIKMDSRRVEAFKLLYPKIIDKEKTYYLLEAFTFQKNREEAEEFMKSREKE